MKIKLVKSEWLDDWYTVERVEHEGRQWLEPAGPNCMRLMDSGRISDACVEGTADEMRELAHAIKARGSASFKRCAVSVIGETVYFCSPRNSTRDGVVPLADADAFADQVLAELAAA